MDPITHDAERLERALADWQAGGDAQGAFKDLPAPLRAAAGVALGLDRAGADRTGGARPSFVHALEDQLRADLRVGLAGAPATPSAAGSDAHLARWLLAAAMFLGLGLLAGYGIRGVAPDRETTSEAANPAAVFMTGQQAPAPARAALQVLPWLPAHAPVPPVLVAAEPPVPILDAPAAAPAKPEAAPDLVSSAPVEAAVTVPEATAPPPVEAAAPPVDDPDDHEDKQAAAPAASGGDAPPAPPQPEAPPSRTPDAEPEP